MAKGTSGKSASGASMSKYDVEVEARLQALEKAVKDIAEIIFNSSTTKKKNRGTRKLSDRDI